MSTSATEQGTLPQDQPVQQTEPAAPAAPVEAPPAAAPPGDGPWASDLASLFPDESVRGTVDQFLRSKVQPYTTQLEQQAAAARDAQRLYSDLNENPYDTYVALTTEMFGEEAGAALLAQLQQDLNSQQPPADTSPPQQQQQQQTDPRLENVLAYVEQQQAEAQYDAELARIQEQHSDVNPDLFHPFVAASEGDFDAAYTLYAGWVSQWNASNAAPADPPPEAPPTMGAGTTAPPIERKVTSIADAVDQFLADQRANSEAPPVM